MRSSRYLFEAWEGKHQTRDDLLGPFGTRCLTRVLLLNSSARPPVTAHGDFVEFAVCLIPHLTYFGPPPQGIQRQSFAIAVLRPQLACTQKTELLNTRDRQQFPLVRTPIYFFHNTQEVVHPRNTIRKKHPNISHVRCSSELLHAEDRCFDTESPVRCTYFPNVYTRTAPPFPPRRARFEVRWDAGSTHSVHSSFQSRLDLPGFHALHKQRA